MKTKHERITKPASFAVTETQKVEIIAAAQKAGVRPSTYIREAVLARLEKER